ncbi:MAG: flagellar protein [Melioribacteraceae bacterium]|nr:flagellar protein [Melioribacteraceae bacterium]
MAEVNGINVPFIPIINDNGFSKTRTEGIKSHFDEIFNKELEKVKLSKHALQRLESRNIHLSDIELSKINDAVMRAEAKGSKDSLVMMNDTAFVVNIPNRTVITAMNVKESRENVFTNIDSVVFAQ